MKPPIDPALAARDELATPFRYHLTAAPPAGESVWQRIANAVDDFLSRIFAHVHPGSGGAVVVWVVLALAAGLCAFLVARIVVARARRGSRTADIMALPDEDEAALAHAADDAARRGDMTAAVRLLLRAAVRLLDVRGTLDDDASATVGELRDEVRRREAPVAMSFDEIATAYVTSIYAQHPIDTSAWHRARGAYDLLRGVSA